MTNNVKDIRKNDVEIFFAVDDTYLPIMAPAILSLGEKADPKRVYNIRVLHTGVNEEYKKMILESLTRKNIRIEFLKIDAWTEGYCPAAFSTRYGPNQIVQINICM